ncbi:MAG: hypothetical protein R3B51_04900 [Thermodesulfobacteriota bacterium]
MLSEYDIWTKALPDGRIDHVMRVYLIDGEDNIREIYNLPTSIRSSSLMI